MHNSYLLVTTLQKSTYFSSAEMYDMLITTGKPEKKKEEITMSEMLNRVAVFGGDNGACGSADPKETPASACGSACGSADPDKK